MLKTVKTVKTLETLNVIVICCDTLRADVVDHSWEDYVHTPNLDDLGKDSLIFSNAWGEGEPTIPMRRGFFSGMRSYPWRFQLDDRGSMPNLHGWHAIPTEQTTIAEYLLAKGVATGLISDVYHMFKPTMNFTRGFLSYDYIRGQETDRIRSGPLSKIDMKPYLPDEIANPKDCPGVAQYLLNVLERQKEEDYFAPKVFKSASQWVLDNYENQPFFLWVDSFTPHEFWDPPKHFADAYFKADGIKDYIYPQMVQHYKPLNESEIKRTKALYYGYVTFVDKWVGYLLNVLDDLRLWDNTVVLFTSDHGTELMDKTIFGKSPHAMHPFNFRLNLMVRHPDRSFHGKKLDAYVQNTDILPTVLSFFGVDHEPVDGFDLWQLATGKEKAFRDYLIIGWGETASVRTPEWNLILNTVKEDSNPRLYHIPSDVKEAKNVANDQPQIVSELRGKLEHLLGGSIPAKYLHQPTGKYNVGFSHWYESNLAR